MSGVVEAIHVRAERWDEPGALSSVSASVDDGLEGDYHSDLTLIAAEAVEGLAADTGIQLGPGESRRNVTTRGIDVNALLGRRFRVGSVEAVGVDLAEPCTRLAKMVQDIGVLRGLVHRGGLQAEIVRDGTIAVGDEIEDLGTADDPR